MLDCPKCIGKLEEKNAEGVKVDVCWACEGMWFDKRELGKVLLADSRNFKMLGLDREEFDGKEIKNMADELDKRSGKCPRCNQTLARKPYVYNKSVTVDTCLADCGVWLDGGEVHKLRDRSAVKIVDKIEEAIDKAGLFFDMVAARLFGKRKEDR